jgi:hypothetical protein
MYFTSDRDRSVSAAHSALGPRGAKTVKRQMIDSPHRSGDCLTTTWCGASLTVLKHPHCGHSHASVVRCHTVLGSGVFVTGLSSLMVTAKPLQRRISESPHRSGDCPTTTWFGASPTVLKHPPSGRMTARKGSDMFSKLDVSPNSRGVDYVTVIPIRCEIRASPR